MAVTLALPLAVAATGRMVVLEQGSPAELGQSTALLVSTRPGERRTVPDYGVPDPLFGGVDASEVSTAVRTWEDRLDDPQVDLVTAGVLEHAVLHATSANTSPLVSTVDLPGGGA